MKRIVALILMIVLCCSMVACGGKTEPKETEPKETEPKEIELTVDNIEDYLIIEASISNTYDYKGSDFTYTDYDLSITTFPKKSVSFEDVVVEIYIDCVGVKTLQIPFDGEYSRKTSDTYSHYRWNIGTGEPSYLSSGERTITIESVSGKIIEDK